MWKAKRLGVAICTMCSVVSCSTEFVPFTTTYPTHFRRGRVADDALSAFLSSNSVPGSLTAAETPPEIVELLPGEFQVAALTGYLVCVFDDEGGQTLKLREQQPHEGTLLSPKGSEYQVEVAQGYRARSAARALRELGYSEARLAGFPDVACFIPSDVDLFDQLETTYAEAWAASLNAWNKREQLLDALAQSNRDLIAALGNAKVIASTLDAQIAQAQATARRLEDANAELENQIAALNAQNLQLALLHALRARVSPTVDIKYDPAKDHMLGVLRDHLEDVRNKPWAGGKDMTPYLDHETAEAMDRASKILADPEKEAPDLAPEIRASGIKSIELSSCGRTPLNQMAQTNPAKARPYDSNHAIGIAVDVRLPGKSGEVMGADTPSVEAKAAYGVVEKVLNRAGLTRTVDFKTRSERNHFELTRYSRTNPKRDNKGLNQKRVTMFKAYERAAGAEADRQRDDHDYADSLHKELQNGLDQMTADIKRKNENLRREQERLEKAATKHGQLQRQKEEAADRARQRAEQKAKQHAHGHGDGVGPHPPLHGHDDGGGGSPGGDPGGGHPDGRGNPGPHGGRGDGPTMKPGRGPMP